MKTRVLHVIDSLDLGGAQTKLRNLLRATDRSRWEPEVACKHGRGVFFREFQALGLPVHSLSPRRWLPLWLPRLAWLLRTRRPEIIHLQSLRLELDRQAARRAPWRAGADQS